MAASMAIQPTPKSSLQPGPTTSTGLARHRIASVAAGLRTAARDAGVELTLSYAERVAAHGIARCNQLGVTKLGDGVVIHTVPEAQGGRTIVLGFVTRAGEWFGDGSRHFSREEER